MTAAMKFLQRPDRARLTAQSSRGLCLLSNDAMHKLAFLLLASLAFTACAESRYRSNVKQAPVTPWTQLSRSDYEEVVRLVSNSTNQPIIGITTDHAKNDSTHLHVITGFRDSSTQRWTGIHLEKRAGRWRIRSQGEISPFTARMILSGTF